MFLINKNIKFIFVLFFAVYFMQDFFYYEGTILSRSVMLLFLILSGLYSLLTLKERPQPAIFRWIFMLIGLHIIGSFLSLIQDPIYFNGKHINVIIYNRSVFFSLLPFFPAFYLARRNMINEYDMKVFMVVALIVSIFAYYGNVLQKTGDVKGEITNNFGYYFLSIIPFLILYRKYFLKYVLLTIILFFIFSSAKRGAILAGGVAVCLLLIQQFFILKNRKCFLINLFYFSIGFVLLVVTANYVFEGSEYLQRRLIYTLDGDSSGRDTIYSSLFYSWVHADSYWNYIFGFGPYSSFKIAGISAHNDWLELLTSYGLCGVLLLSGLFFSIIKEIWNKFNPSEYRWCIAIIFSIVFFNSLFVRFIYSIFDSCMLMILLGYVLGRSAVVVNDKNSTYNKIFKSIK